MRIAFDVESILRNRYSGFFTYGTGLLSGFADMDDRPNFTFFCSPKVLDSRKWLNDIPAGRWCVSPFKMRHLQAWWRWSPAPTLARFTGEFDLYHAHHHLMPPTKGKPRLLTVHDLRRQRYPQFYPHSKTSLFADAVRKADHIIAISRATKNDLLDFFSLSEDRIDVVYHGGLLPGLALQEDEPVLPAALEEAGLRKQRYFAAFSSYDKRKNLTRIMEAFCGVCSQLEGDYRLAVIGQRPEGEMVPAGMPETAGRVVFTGMIESVMPVLANARGLVYTSLYEGFGLPILEAMAAGTAVITSNCSSMPEVAGEAALLVDPLSVEEIGTAMLKMAEDESRREELVKAGKERIKMFSWQKAAAETYEVYKKILL